MWHVAAKPAPRKGWEAFAQPTQVNQRRYEALRAYVLDGAPLAEAADRVGYSPSALASLARDLRAGELALFAYPGTKVIPVVSWLLSLLALKLTATRRVSHVDGLLDDPASALFAGLAVLPKKSALTEYSYRLSHEHQRSFLAALDQKMIGAGLAAADQAVFDLDFHAVMHWGHDPVLEKHYVPTRSQPARPVLTSFAPDSQTHNPGAS